MNREDAHKKLKELELRIPFGYIGDKLEWCLLYEFSLHDEITTEAALQMQQYYTEGAELGIPMAALNLGAMYYSGDLIPRDYRRAFQYYKIAAEQNEEPQIAAIAYANMGYCYMYGRDVPVDEAKAYECFQKGSETYPYIVNFYKLGDMYRYGIYVVQNDIMAWKYYKEALDHLNDNEDNRQNAGDILKRIGECWLYGIGVKKNTERALDYFYDAKEMLEVEARTGNVFAEGIIRKLDQDIAEAEKDESQTQPR